MEVYIAVIAAVFAAAFALSLWFISRRKGVEASLIQAQLESLRAEVHNSLASNQRIVATQLAGVTGQVTEQLSIVASQLQSSTGQINQRMDNAARAVGEVRERLGELSKATERIFEVGKDISTLQEILRAPKLRGGLGEFFLADLLGQCLPADHFEVQYTFSGGARVDAVIKLNEGLVPIDSKFPLENFRRLVELSGDERRAARRRFLSDCKKHIDAIASSYILPEEGTFNFALMYIPAENVYYETIVKDDEQGAEALSAYAFSRRVIPVSPNTFYAYLQTILLGLKGMEVSREAREIFASIEGLRGDFEKLSTDLDVLGRHITNTKQKFEEVQRKTGRFGEKLEGMGERA